MTEEEAKTKWCPFARVLGTLRQPAEPGGHDYVVGQGAQNRGFAMGGPLDNCCCIASACMSWRWSEAKRSAAFLEAVQARMQAQTKPNFNTATQEVYAESGGQFERVEGFCGLAGGER